MRLTRALWLCLCALGSALPLATHAASVVLDDRAVAQGKVPLAGHLAAYYDASGELTLAQVSSAGHQAHFKPLPQHFNGGFARSGAWWLRFEMQAAPGLGGDWWLQLVAPYVDRLEVWLPQRAANGTQTLRHRVLGTTVPASARDISALTPVIRLDALPEGPPLTVWMRVSGQRTLSVAGNLWRFPALSAEVLEATVERASVIGMVLFMAVLTALLGALLRDRQFLWYSAYLGATALLFASSEGLIHQLLLPEAPALGVRLYGILMTLHLLTSVTLTLSLLEMKTQFPRLAVAYRLLGVASVFALMLAIADRYTPLAPALNVARLLLSMTTIALCFVLVLRKLPSALPNLIGYSVYGAAGILLFAKNLGLLPYNDLTQYGYLIGVVVHMLALFMGMALRVRGEERRALQVQTQALENTRAAAVQLERKVAERTVELSAEVQERRKAQDRLTEALQEQRNFLAMASHEFRTPLSIIDASAQMLVDGHAPPDEQSLQREIGKVQRATQRMVSLLDTLLADDWLDSAKMHLRPSRYDLLPLLHEGCEQLRSASGRELRYLPQAATLEIVADAALLRIAIGNLLENAVKYSPAQQPIELRVELQGEQVSITVRDHGPGIRSDDLERIFERHYRSPQMLTRPGLGLGLYLVRRIAELHGGTVSVRNADGGGAEFRLGLPRYGKATQE